MAIQDYSTNPSNNQYINGVFIGEDCPPANINNAIREVMADQATANFTAQINNVQYLAQQADNKAQQAMDNVSTVNNQAAASANLAKDYKDEAKAWAEGSDADVSTYQPGGHSAKTYAADAQAYAQAADTDELNAAHWAEGSDADVGPLGGTHSAKGWADICAAAGTISDTYVQQAKKWAEGTDQEVSALGGTHSAKVWAEEAADAAAEVKEKIGQVKVLSLQDDLVGLGKYVATGNYYLKATYPDLAKLFPYNRANYEFSYSTDNSTNPLAVNSLPLADDVTDEYIWDISEDGRLMAMIDSTRTKVLLYSVDFAGVGAPVFTSLTTIDTGLDYIHGIVLGFSSSSSTNYYYLTAVGGTDNATITGTKAYRTEANGNLTTWNAVSGLTVSFSPGIVIDTTDVSLINKPFGMGLGVSSTSYFWLTVKTGAAEITRYQVKSSDGTITSQVRAGYILLDRRRQQEACINDSNKIYLYGNASSVTPTYSKDLSSVISVSDLVHFSIADYGYSAFCTADKAWVCEIPSAAQSEVNLQEVLLNRLSGSIKKVFLSPGGNFLTIQNNNNIFELFKKYGGDYLFSTRQVGTQNANSFNARITNQGLFFQQVTVGYPKAVTSYSSTFFYVPLYDVPSGFRSYVRALD